MEVPRIDGVKALPAAGGTERRLAMLLFQRVGKNVRDCRRPIDGYWQPV